LSGRSFGEIQRFVLNQKCEGRDGLIPLHAIPREDGAQSATCATKNQEHDQYHQEARHHHEGQASRSLQLGQRGLGLRIGTARGGLVQCLQEHCAKLRPLVEDQDLNTGKDGEDEKTESPGESPQLCPHATRQRHTEGSSLIEHDRGNPSRQQAQAG
jgi:hypothetical protein